MRTDCKVYAVYETDCEQTVLIEESCSRLFGPELFCCVKGACHERLPAPADRRHAEAGDGLQGHRQEDQAVTGQRTELLQVAPPRRLWPGGGGCLQLERHSDGAELGRYGLYHGTFRPGVQGYVAAFEGAVQTPDGREHQAGQRKIRRKDRRNRGVHHGTRPLHQQQDWQWQCL